MLEYAKVVLCAVCFQEVLFKKELAKIVSWAHPQEIPELKRYVHDKYYSMYPEIIDAILPAEKSLERNISIIKTKNDAG